MKKRAKAIFAILFFLFVIIIALRDNWKYRKRFDAGERTVAYTEVSNKNIHWHYTIEGKSYNGAISKSHFPYLQNGEKYNVYYDRDNPSSSSISFVEPIVDTALFGTVLSLPFDENYKKGSKFVHFFYVIEKDTLERYHLLKFHTDIFSKGKRFLVYYKLDNPFISYVNIEQWNKLYAC